MKIAIALLLALAATVACVSTVDLSPTPTTITALNLFDRMTYINNLNDFYRCDSDGSTLYVTIQVTLLNPAKIVALALDAYGVSTALGRLGSGPIVTFYSDNSLTRIRLNYTASMLNPSYGCEVMPAIPGYVGRVCNISLDFRAKDQDTSLLTIGFKAGIMIKSSTQAVVAMATLKQVRNMASLYVTQSYSSVMAIYDPTCTTLSTTTSFVYGDKVCLKFSSPTGGDIVNSYVFNLVMLNMTYSSDNGITTTTPDMLSMAYSITNTTGLAQVVIGLPVVSKNVIFSATVSLETANKRLLRQLRLLGDITPGTTALSGSTTPSVEVKPNSATSVSVSILGLLLIFFALL